MHKTLSYRLLLTLACVLFSGAMAWAQDSLAQEAPKEKPGFLKEEVKYRARDSIRTDLRGEVIHLYGEAKIEYDGIVLEADYIALNMKDNSLYAEGVRDSLGVLQGKPVFNDHGAVYKSETIHYNFDTGKGKISKVLTEEGGGYVHGQQVKKVNDSTYYIKNGSFTTCDLEHPHFYIGSSKLKIMPGDKIVTGPAYLVLHDIPTPLIVPFGYFPTTSKQTSGIILPAPGKSNNKGYFLRNGGYYFAISDRMDLKLIGEIFSRGSWGLSSVMRYANRYKRSGQLTLSYNYNKTSEPEFPDYSLKKDVFIRWNHKQDPKARPNSNFSASVNAGSSSFLRNTSTVSNDIIKNDLVSSISYSRVFPNTPFTMNLNANHNQKLSDRTITLKLPQMSVNMARIYPFKRKKQVGKQAWYEKVGVTYSMELLNQISTYDSLLFTEASLGQFRNGMRHRASATTALKVFKHFSLTPQFSYNENWYLSRIEKSWDPDSARILTDTIQAFSTNRFFNTGANLTTKIYGMANFRSKHIKAIRHVFSPSIGYRYQPDFSKDPYNFYGQVQTDTLGNTTTYSFFENGIFGNAPTGEQSNLTYTFGNILEMKVANRKDTANATKKIKLIESLNISGSYNFAASEYQWSQVNFTARTRIYKDLTLKFDGVLDPYTLDTAGQRIPTLVYSESQRLGRWTRGGMSVNWNLRGGSGTHSTPQVTDINGIPYVDFTLPWDLNLYYTFNYSKPGLESNTSQSLNFNGNVRLTDKWKIGFNSGYDFINKDLTFTRLNIYRDLHCWELIFDWIPFGQRQSYTLTLRVKSSVLQDLKVDRRRNWFDF